MAIIIIAVIITAILAILAILAIVIFTAIFAGSRALVSRIILVWSKIEVISVLRITDLSNCVNKGERQR